MSPLFLYLSLYAVVSADDSLESVFEEAEERLEGIEGIRLEESESGDLQLSGKVYRSSDLERIRKFQKTFPKIKSHFSLAGTAQKKEARASASSASNQPSILLEMVLVELKKTALKKMGLRIPSPMSLALPGYFQILGGNERRMDLVTADPIRAFLDMAIQSGEAKVHAKQSMVVQNGKEGEFRAGGEFPIKVASGFAARIVFKEYGLFLKFTPHLIDASRIHLQISSEISDLLMTSLADGVPVISRKLLKTQVNARLNEMMALGGIVHSSQSQYTDRIPGLGDLPILGRLFKSEDFKKQSSEAYIFVSARKMDKAWLPSPDL